ncbi:maleylpyruvate isomerase family mycothiol-dependent enzyme [Phycicoccus flavus]|uniref:maleylpyruvate isomerase family mycothiol-dependent enzyme n=1 Tax=Phycicoccus flavus TaxID=2502783 RepID=UPI000FEBF808|nr:maleylpyruvate isomerase family mycothiol-dependent enzyme [Phycicoccus flavus]NHA70126.1 maleylpyruvate isomerase family mycothiol-dependent enzyme [Phycicoccus flavus]
MAPDLDWLAVLDTHQSRLDATAEALDDVAAPSLCAGWTRGHVLSHLARNAEAVTTLCRSAVEDTGEPMYASAQARDADIEAGAHRDARTQALDVRDTGRLVALALARLTPEHADRQLERTPGGSHVAAGFLPVMRVREVVLHHVDLDAGFGFADLEPDLVDALLEEEVTRLRAVDDPPDVTLRATGGREWTVGAGTATVDGDPAGLLAWLARGLTDGVHADPLPRLPGGR